MNKELNLTDRSDAIYSNIKDEELIELMKGFVSDAGAMSSTFRSLIENKAFERLALEGHTLKGTSAMYGYPDLSRAAFKLENAAKDVDMESAEQAVVAIGSILERIRKGFDLRGPTSVQPSVRCS
jgi:HPt (histidine-containing phosphotransfer) domain-containing protein